MSDETQEATEGAASAPPVTEEPPKKKRGRPKLPKNDNGPPAEPMGRGCSLGEIGCEAERIHDWGRIAQDPGAVHLTLCPEHAARLAAARKGARA